MDGVFEAEGPRWRWFSGKSRTISRQKRRSVGHQYGNPGTRAASTVYVRYRDCLSTATQAELPVAEVGDASLPETLRIDYPRKGDISFS